MKSLKLKAFISLFVLATALSSRATVNSILWNVDSYSGFDLTITGTGSGASFPGLTSPSGLWKLIGGAGAGRGLYEPLYVSAASYMEFLGAYPTSTPYQNSPYLKSLEAHGYHDSVPSKWVKIVDGTLHDGQRYDDGELRYSYYGHPEWAWEGLTTIDFVIGDVNDFSTWSWTEHYYASGPSLAPDGPVPVPEPGTVSLWLAGSLLALAVKKTRRSH